jgi:predicted Zn-dependent protease with MMP-like domain
MAFDCSEDEFAAIAEEELDALPPWIQQEIERRNVAIDIEDERPGSPRTLGLYQSRTMNGAAVREITLFRIPILRAAGDRSHLRRAVHDTLLHELGHLFGMTEGDLDGYTIGNDPRPGAEPVHPPRDDRSTRRRR